MAEIVCMYVMYVRVHTYTHTHRDRCMHTHTHTRLETFLHPLVQIVEVNTAMN